MRPGALVGPYRARWLFRYSESEPWRMSLQPFGLHASAPVAHCDHVIIGNSAGVYHAFMRTGSLTCTRYWLTVSAIDGSLVIFVDKEDLQ